MQSDREIFFEALDMPDAPGRAAFVKSACGSDEAAQARVLALLANHFSEDGFMDQAAAPEASMDRLPGDSPGNIIGRYKLLEKIGEGGVGDVYVAEQREPVKRKVALKVIKLGMDTRQVVARFEAERQAMAMMDHPNIAKAFDAGASEAGRPYFIMELVRGVRITQFCDENRLSTENRLKLFIQVCLAVQHAHQKGIIHRDIKPSNILVTLHDGVPTPKVIDFGIAKATQTELTEKTIYTQFHHFIGTPAYMSPEQAEMNGLDIDTRTDIYSLGVLLYELLTGSTPFDGKKLAVAGIEEMRKTIRETDAVRPSTRVATLESAALSMAANQRRVDTIKLKTLLKGDLDWIVMKCLEKDRQRRYATVQDLCSDVQRFLNDEPIMARPPTAAYQMQKAWRRHRAVISGAVILALVLVAGIAASSWQAVVATRAKAEALASQKTEKEAREVADREKKIAQANLYAVNLNMIPQAWDERNMGRVRQLLEATRSFSGRGIEWYYWQHRFQKAVKTLRGHYMPVRAVSFSPDGRKIATGSDDGNAIIWDGETGEELRVLDGHIPPVNEVAWSADSRWLATVSDDHTARIWDANSGMELLKLEVNGVRLNCAVISPDGKKLFVGGADGILRFWELPEGNPIMQIPVHESILAVAISPDGTRLATAGMEGSAKVLETATGKEIATMNGHSDWTQSICFSPDGNEVLTGSDDWTARIWDAWSGKEKIRVKGHSYYVSAATFSPDGKTVATVGADWTMKIWNRLDGKEISTFMNHQGELNCVSYSLDGSRVATGSSDGTVVIWNLAEQQKIFLEGATGFNAGAFSHDGQKLAAGSGHFGVTIWDAATGKVLQTFKAHKGGISSIEFSDDDRRILTGGVDGTAHIWDAFNGKDIIVFKTSAPVLAAAFSPNQKKVVTGGADSSVRIWNAETGEDLLSLKGHSWVVMSVAFSSDGKKVISGSRDGTVIVWDANTGQRLALLETPNEGSRNASFSESGTRIIAGGYDRTARIWELETRQQTAVLEGHSSWFWKVGFHGNRVFTSSSDQTVRLWEPDGGHELLKFPGQGRAIWFSKDNTKMLFASEKEIDVISFAKPEDTEYWQRQEEAGIALVEQRGRVRLAKDLRANEIRETDPGLVKEWLVAVPIHCRQEQSTKQALSHDFVGDESALQPKPGDRLKGEGFDLAWQPLKMAAGYLDFNKMVSQETPRSVAYAVSYLISDTEQTGVIMKVGSDDHSKVYLNTREVYSFSRRRYMMPDEDSVTNLTLKAGTNVVVFKVVNHGADWKGSLRFTDSHSRSLKGLSVLAGP